MTHFDASQCPRLLIGLVIAAELGDKSSASIAIFPLLHPSTVVIPLLTIILLLLSWNRETSRTDDDASSHNSITSSWEHQRLPQLASQVRSDHQRHWLSQLRLNTVARSHYKDHRPSLSMRPREAAFLRQTDALSQLSGNMRT